MSKTLTNILNGAGPDPMFLAALQKMGNFGDMLTPQRRSVTTAAAAILRCSTLGIPPMRAGAVAHVTAGLAASEGGICNYYISSGSWADDVPAAGLTVGTANAQVRLIPKPGYTVRYAQFNQGSLLTTGPTYALPSQTLGVFVSLKGKVCEIWTRLANSAAIVATSTANQVIAAIRADGDAMTALQTVDAGTGTGVTAAVNSTRANIVAFRPHSALFAAAGASTPEFAPFGNFVTSQDGELIAFWNTLTDAVFDYQAAPLYPLENFYDGGAD